MNQRRGTGPCGKFFVFCHVFCKECPTSGAALRAEYIMAHDSTPERQTPSRGYLPFQDKTLFPAMILLNSGLLYRHLIPGKTTTFATGTA